MPTHAVRFHVHCMLAQKYTRVFFDLDECINIIPPSAKATKSLLIRSTELGPGFLYFH